MKKLLLSVSIALLLAACAQMVPEPAEPSGGHIRSEPQPAGDIPELVSETPFLPPPAAVPETEKYTVVVSDVPVRELLFALARDADINIDIYPGIEGLVTLNAVDQTLPQILERLSHQVDLRYTFKDTTLIVEPDLPYFRTYKVDYVNLSRDTSNEVNIATQIETTSGSVSTGSGGGSSGGGGNNNSTTKVTSQSKNRFWETLSRNLVAIIGEGSAGTSSGLGSDNVIISSETGVVNINATRKQHQKIQSFLDMVIESARRQVLVEVTIVEVSLNDEYQAGIRWSLLNNNTAGFSLLSSTSSVLSGTPAPAVLNYFNQTTHGDLNVALDLLQTFGDTKVLSSPKMMVLNNQTAVLKVVQNFVYFEIDVEPCTTNVLGGGACEPAVDTTAKTVPVGLVMTVTPQIGDQDEVLLIVRPTITSNVGTVDDPNPELVRSSLLAGSNLTNPVPIIRVREMESILKIRSGDTAVLGGLMEDEVQTSKHGIPLFSDIPGIGQLFDVDSTKTVKKELVIFLRPTVIKNASVNDDLRSLRPYLDETSSRVK